jgi:hypothetical protein
MHTFAQQFRCIAAALLHGCEIAANPRRISHLDTVA